MVQVTKDVGITRCLAEFGRTLAFEDLPPQVVRATKQLCLDLLGVALSGSTTPSARAVVQAMNRVGRSGPSVVIGTPHRALPEYAALANGAAGHSLDFDDVNNEASIHPGVVVFPTTLACADLAPVDGKAFIAAATVGYEVMIRLGRGLKPAEHYGRGFHPTATCGAFGAAAVTARLLGLEGDPFVSALGIAGSQAAGSMEFLAQGTWIKRMHPGWAAHSGILAALLAREGFTGPDTIIEGRTGFLHAYSGDPAPDLVLQDLGDVFHIARTSVKPHACCRYKHGPIDCVLELVSRHRLRPSDIEKVTVGILEAGFNIIAAPEEEKRNPVSVVEMQFSMPFGVAVAVLYGRAFSSEYSPGVAQRPEVKGLMDRVQCVRDPALEARYPTHWPAWVEIATKDGRTLRADTDSPKGDPDNPLSWRELKAKFTDLSVPLLPPGRQEEIIATVERLDELTDVRELTRLLAAG